MDLLVQTESGTRINIEMQKDNKYNTAIRSEYHLARTHGNQLNKNQDFREIKPTVVISLLNYVEFRDPVGGARLVRSFSFRDDKSYESLNGRTTLYFVEIPKVKDIARRGLLEAWCLFLQNPEDLTMQQFYEKYPELAKAKEIYDDFMSDPKHQAELLMAEKAEIDQMLALQHAKDKGKEEGMEIGKEKGMEIGREEGKAEGIRAMVKALVANGYKDIGALTEASGLSSEAIEQLIEKEE